jgi:hypothetical protein
VRASDVFTRRLHGSLAAAAERGPVDFPELLLTPGVGARTVQSLAMVAEVVHGAPFRFRDPARFSLAHGGKDRHPYPVPIKVYDETIRVMKSAIQKAKLGRDEELQALKRLDHQARLLERTAKGPSLAAFIANERSGSPALGGRSVFGHEEETAKSGSQLRLIDFARCGGAKSVSHQPIPGKNSDQRASVVTVAHRFGSRMVHPKRELNCCVHGLSRGHRPLLPRFECRLPEAYRVAA